MNVDPIQLELMRNLFEAAAEEMGITLARVAFSANIKERRDFSGAVFDPERLGDLDAQVAANRVGAGAVVRMMEAHGAEEVLAYGRALLDYSQSFLARTISEIGDGEFPFEDVLDDDGTGFGPVGIRAVVTI